jgi:hypothetical protein
VAKHHQLLLREHRRLRRTGGLLARRCLISAVRPAEAVCRGLGLRRLRCRELRASKISQRSHSRTSSPGACAQPRAPRGL